MRYRVELKTKILGPFELEELFDLYNNGEISSKNKIQLFPHGDWLLLEELEAFKNYNLDNKTREDETHLLILKNINKENEASETIQEEVEKIDDTPLENAVEFSFDKNPETNQKVEEDLEPTIETQENESGLFELDIESDNVPDEAKKNDNKKEEIKDTLATDKTKVRTTIKQLKSELDPEKTQINPDYQKYLEKLKKEEEEKIREEERKKQEIELAPDYERDETMIGEYTLVDASLIERVQEELAEEQRAEIKRNKKKKKKEQEDDEELEEYIEEDSKSKMKIIIIIIALVFGYLEFMDGKNDKKETIKKIKLVEPPIAFPLRFDKPDPVNADKLYKAGYNELIKFNYKSSVKASKLLRESLENQFDNNPAAPWLIFLYSHMLQNSNNYIKDATTIFKLVQYFESSAFSSPTFASSVSYFYFSIEQYAAAVKTFDKYITLHPTSATPELFAVRLMALLKIGDLEKAGSTADKLETIKTKNIFTLEALFEYYRVQQNYNKMLDVVKEVDKIDPNNTRFTVEKALLEIKNKNLKELNGYLLTLNSSNVDGSKYLYSKYLMIKGFYFIAQQKIDVAVNSFNESLKLFSDNELIATLSALEEGGDQEVNSLISDTKAIKLIRRGKTFYIAKDYKTAMRYALEATSIAPTSIDAKLFLADVQVRLGYIDYAISSLETLYSQHSSSLKVIFALIDGYIEAYRFKKVVNLLSTAQSMVSDVDYKFYAAKAKFALFNDELNAASGWLQRAINANPVDDDLRYQLAKLYIQYHDYQKGKLALKKAMDLNPAKLEYRVEYAQILYEMENAETAIGYLYSILEDFPDNPKVLSSIGIYYYRSGQHKRYNEIKEKLTQVPGKDSSLYEFLIEASRLDDDIEKVIQYSKELIIADPGNLKVRMDLTLILIELKRYKEAKVQLDEIEKRFKSYPRLQYTEAKLYYLVNDLDKSRELVLEEIKLNPTVVESYVLLGDIYSAKKEFENARKEYLRALQLKPKNIEAILGLAKVAYISDQYDMALDQYEKAIRIEPGRAESYRLLADVYRKLGQGQLAIKNYKLYLELNPNTKQKAAIETYIRTMK